MDRFRIILLAILLWGGSSITQAHEIDPVAVWWPYFEAISSKRGLVNIINESKTIEVEVKNKFFEQVNTEVVGNANFFIVSSQDNNTEKIWKELGDQLIKEMGKIFEITKSDMLKKKIDDMKRHFAI